ncbi:hypothetical protein BDN70DRAFT_939522 [Pholiota conissans]|uniref:Uncharacterized protein n=1 Tax=Pholiota conissans TaxID=109636 RepID=A0A9P6CQZ2_9AGAR|nr:hypothetical protein BDN70DRAFT_939522 [Pholiota conissans]
MAEHTEVDESPLTFNGPLHRSRLLQHGNYAASDGFPYLWKWKQGRGSLPSKLIVDGEEGECEDVYCRVVGTVSPDDRLFLEPHGNFNPAFETPIMAKSKLQFTLTKPSDPDFGQDYTLAYRRLEAVQDAIAHGPDRSWFLNDGTMRFSFPLWEKKIEGNNGPEETALTEHYTVRDDLMDEKRKTQENHQICIMRVSRWKQNKLIEPAQFASTMTGALVEVTFVLRHYFYKERQGSKVSKDTNSYTAQVHEIIILNSAPPRVRTPFQNRRVGGAISVSQSPKKTPSKETTPSRGEQVAAANAFGPQTPTREKRKRTDDEPAASTPSKKGKEKEVRLTIFHVQV